MNEFPVRVGDEATFAKTVSESDVYLFAGITGDLSPNHVNEEAMRQSKFGRRIVHGALLVGYMSNCSTALCARVNAPDETPVSLGYDRIRFIAPVFIGDTITVTYRIVATDPIKRQTRADVRVSARGELCVAATHILRWVPNAAQVAMGAAAQDQWALVNGRVVERAAVTQGKAVVIGGDKIVGVTEVGALGAEIARVDVGGRFITPGLIDLHTHGALGHTFNEPTTEAFAAITRENARRGVTGLLATLATAPIPDLARCLEFCRGWMRAQTFQVSENFESLNGSRVLGAYLESPYISPAQKGALDPANIHTPDDGTVDALLAYRDVLTIFMLAPELPGALELTRRLAELGIIVAAGHSSARDEHVRAAMRVGLRHVTHIWSAMSSVVREGPWRKPGLLEAALTFDGLSVEMIADNKHLPPTLMQLAYKCIGADRLCVISDATSGAGLPEGARFKMGGMEYDVHDGVGMMLDRSAFAGSATLVNQMIPILTTVVGIPLVEALRMLTLTPARVIGVEDRKGSLAPGKDADLAIFDDDWRAWRTIIAGRWIPV